MKYTHHEGRLVSSAGSSMPSAFIAWESLGTRLKEPSFDSMTGNREDQHMPVTFLGLSIHEKLNVGTTLLIALFLYRISCFV